ncbi:plasmid mobilization protein [Pedobacter sp. NJ-S-72]
MKIKKRNKGGRPKAALKRDASISVMCNIIEKKLIQGNAKKVGTNASVYLRELGLNGTSKLKVKTLPKEVLAFTGMLNHMAANLNQIAKRRNSGEDLNAMDRALLNQEVRAVQATVEEVRSYLK